MTSFITILFLGLIGILTVVLVFRLLFALAFGIYIFSNLVLKGTIRARSHIQSLSPARSRISKAPAEQDKVEPIANTSPKWALIAQCLIWGSCKTQQAQK